jgi:heme-degrading monooxygenase HmoA
MGCDYVIVRMWRGWSDSNDASLYERHYQADVLPVLRQIAGFRGAHLLRRAIDDETVTFFDDLDAVRAFAGEDYEAAVLANAARRLLVRFDTRVLHFDVAVQI